MVRTQSVQEHTADPVSREDRCASLGAKSNFKDTINTETWEPATLWETIVQFHRDFWKVDSSGKAMSSGTKTSKAKPTRNFGRLLEVGEEDGLPVLPSRAELESWKSQSAQYWSAVVRQFLNVHHGNAFHCQFQNVTEVTYQRRRRMGWPPQCPGPPWKGGKTSVGFRREDGLPI